MDDMKTCPTCGGSGKVKKGMADDEKTCPTCGGSGKVPAK
jgi:DnaJ-class molecular chaperone